MSVAKILRKNCPNSNYFSNFACDFAKIQTIITNNIMDLTGKVIAIMEARGGVSARTGNACYGRCGQEYSKPQIYS